MFRRIFIVFIISIFIFNLISGCKPPKKEETDDKSISVKVVKAKLSTITSGTTQIGTIKALEESKISSKVPGKVTNIYVKEGDFVSTGQIILTLDRTDLNTQFKQAQAGVLVAEAGLAKVLAGSRIENIEQAKSALNQAKANLVNAKSNLDRMEELYEQQVITKQALEGNQTQYKVAKETYKTAEQQLKMLTTGATKEDINISRAQVRQARTAMDTAKQQLNNTTITSPFSGVIAQKLVNYGEVINPSAPLFILVQMGTVKVRVDISETLIRYFSTGKNAKIKLDAYPDLNFEGTVRNISPVINQQSRTFWVDVFINNPKHLIKPGMFARLTFDIETHPNVLTAPLETVFNKGEDKYVYIIKNNIANLSPKLKIGITTNNEIEILEGVKTGDELVTRGIQNLVDKAKVRVIR